MANREEYIFNVDAEVSRAVEKLGKIRKLMDSIDSVRNKGVDNYYTTNQKDMDKNMRSMKQLTQMYRQMSKELEDTQRRIQGLSSDLSIPEGSSKEVQEQINRMKSSMADYASDVARQQASLRAEYQQTLLKFREVAAFQQNYSKSFKHVFNSNDVFNLPTDDFEKAKRIVHSMANEADGVSSKLDDVVAKMREINKLDRRSESLSRRASASKYMSYQQASNFRKDLRTVNVDYKQERTNNLNTLAQMGMERSRISKQIKDIERNPEATQREIDKKIALQQTIESMDKEWEARMELNKVLERTISNMDRYNASIQDATVKPERGTVKGMMYERAPAIGLAVTGAMAGTVGSLYHQGASINKGMRNDEISIGQRTGTAGTEWRKTIRDGALKAGLADKLGMSGQEMLSFQDNYLSKKGFSSMSDLNTAMQNQAIFSRVSGVGTEDTKSFFNSVYGSGAVNGKQTKEIQNAFLGAIKRSGMEGREKDQLKALEGILSGMSSNRSLSNQDIMNVMGLQSVFAQSGEKALQGEKGGQLLAGLDEGIRKGFDNPKARLVYGQGTKYQGLSGMYDLQVQMEKGLSDVKNLDPLIGMAKSYGMGDESAENGVFARAARELLGVDVSAQQAKGIMDLHRSGKLNQKTLDEVMKEDSSVGNKIAKDKEKQYKDSSAAIDNQSDATTEKQAAGIYDMGEVVRRTNGALSDMPAPIYGAIAAIVALGVAAAGAAISFGASAFLRNRMGQSFGRGGGGTPPIGGGAGRGGSPRGGGSGGGGVSWRRGGTSTPTPPPSQSTSMWGKIAEKGKGIAAGVGTAFASAGLGIGKFASGAWEKVKGAGKGNFFKGSGGSSGSGGGGLFKGAGGKLLGGLGALGSFMSLKWASDAGDSMGDWLFGHKKGDIKAPGLLDNPFKTQKWDDDRDSAFKRGWNWITGGGEKKKEKPAEKPKSEDKPKESKPTAPTSTATAPTSSGATNMSGFGTTGTVAGVTTLSMSGGVAGGMLANNLDPGLTDKVVTPGSSKDGVNTTKEQVDKENTNTRQRTELKKTDNLAYERENISLYEKVLQRADALLAQARSQNGIMGNSNGAGGTGGGAGSGMGISAGGKLQILQQGQKWSNNNLRQHDLGFTDGSLTAADLDAWIDSKAPKDSMFRGMGATFLKAGQESGLDPRYLIAHAAEESAWGTSRIAKDKKNFFGIGAFDNSPYASAYGFGNTVESGIIGGAKWIADKYYGKGNTTLDKMHQAGYATNSTWASNIASIMGGAPSGTGSVSATINVNVKGDEKVSEKIKDKKELKDVGSNIWNSIYGMNFYTQEQRRY